MYQNKTEMNKHEIAEATKEDNNGNNDHNDEHFEQLNGSKWKQNEKFCMEHDKNETDNCSNRLKSITCTIRFENFKWLAL